MQFAARSSIVHATTINAANTLLKSGRCRLLVSRSRPRSMTISMSRRKLPLKIEAPYWINRKFLKKVAQPVDFTNVCDVRVHTARLHKSRDGRKRRVQVDVTPCTRVAKILRSPRQGRNVRVGQILNSAENSEKSGHRLRGSIRSRMVSFRRKARYYTRGALVQTPTIDEVGSTRFDLLIIVAYNSIHDLSWGTS